MRYNMCAKQIMVVFIKEILIIPWSLFSINCILLQLSVNRIGKVNNLLLVIQKSLNVKLTYNYIFRNPIIKI